MSDDELGRLRGDLAVIRSAMGLHLPFGRGTLAAGLLLAATATAAAVVSLLVESDALQQALPAAVMIAASGLLYLGSRRGLDPEVVTQIAVSVCVYAVVWVAACAYLMAGMASLETWRTAALHACGSGLLLGFSFLLVRAAVTGRRRHYCLGLAASAVLAGMLFPLLDRDYVLPLAHALVALGFLAGVAIQSAQLREAVHAAD